MKLRCNNYLLILVIIFLMGTGIPAACAAETIGITVDGMPMDTDVPSYIDGNSRTMVPVRFVSEALGCAVIWNAGEQRARISRSGCTVDLNIGRKVALVNGSEVAMDTTAVLKGGRTMVPLRFLAETFGLSVDWNEGQKMVAIKSPPASPEPAPPEKDNPQGKPPEGGPDLRVGTVSGNSVNVRSGPGTDYDKLTQVNAGTRLAVLGVEGEWVQVELAGGTKGWIFGSYVNLQASPSPGDINLGGNYAMPSDVARFALVMKDSVNVRSMPNENSAVLDQVSSGQQLEITGKQDDWLAVRLSGGGSGWIAGWLAAVGYSTDKKSASSDSGRSLGLISRWSPGVQAAGGDLPLLTGVDVEKTGEGVLLKVNAAASLAMPSSFRLNNPSRLVFDFNANMGEDSVDPVLQVGQEGPVGCFRLGQFDGQTVRIVADLQDAASYALSQSPDGRTITIQIRTVDSKGRLIVIDPGHGALQTWGSDPGAVGPTGLRERDVVRSISLQLGNILLNEGFTVIYTHEGETGLSLEDRALVAGISGAELLVSVHANASTNRSLAGTMTFYHAPQASDQLDQLSNRKLLAGCIQTELLSRLQREDKGISGANYAVLRNCPIPAALVEVAFISNPEEEKLLAGPDFQRRAAEAIALGIKRYLAARR